MENKRLKLNTIFGFISQVIVLICGLILPRFILNAYGSNVNGLINSITSFLNVISLMEFGVGAVAQTALYKPLVKKDEEMISKVYIATKRFFKLIGLIFIIYVIVISIVISFLNVADFGFIFTFFLVIVMAISFFAEYYFGLANSILISADQKIYVIYITKAVTIVLNTILCCLLINNGAPIHFIKLTTSLIYLFRPFIFIYYVKRKYKLVKTEPEGDELNQRWNAFIQHLTAFVITNIDVIVLSIFSTLANVSIYAIYYMIVKAIQELIVSSTSGVKAYYGHILAIGNDNLLFRSYNKFTFLITSLSTIVFSIAMITILPFVTIYTKEVTDVNYFQPIFAVFLLIGQTFYLYRYNFNLVIVSAGHYKQTQLSALIEAIVNILVSCVSVYYFGLVGVAIGTIAAMGYRTVYFSIYISKNIIKKAYKIFLKQMIISIVIMLISALITLNTNYNIDNYIEWIIFAIKNGIFILIIYIFIEFTFNIKYIFKIMKKVKN